MRGLWSADVVGGFERSSGFFDKAQVSPKSEEERQELLHGVTLEPTVSMQSLKPGLYEVDFVGRKTLYPGEYDIFGARHLIVIDQLVSYKPVSIDDGTDRQPL
jgi:hypothetical protein